MQRNILIISSEHTGYGHKSIAEAISEQLNSYSDVKVSIVDGYSFGSDALKKFGAIYGKVTRTSTDLWKLFWDFTFTAPWITIDFIEKAIEHNLLRYINKSKPDVILAIHPGFVSSVLNIMTRHKINIPFVTFVADLVSLTPLWADPRADFTLCPTVEAKNKCIQFGVPPQKIKVTGFPIRERFCRKMPVNVNNKEVQVAFSQDKPINCLLMSGGEGSGNMAFIARTILDFYNSSVTVVTGKNLNLKKRLDIILKTKYQDRVNILGFVNNIEELMDNSDIVICRASPNVMFEAINCNVPLVLTGSLPGQEEGNLTFADKYDLGVVCKNLSGVKKAIRELIDFDGLKLNHIKERQQKFQNPDSAKNIADFIVNLAIEHGHAQSAAAGSGNAQSAAAGSGNTQSAAAGSGNAYSALKSRNSLVDKKYYSNIRLRVMHRNNKKIT